MRKKHQMLPPLWQNLQQLWGLFYTKGTTRSVQLRATHREDPPKADLYMPMLSEFFFQCFGILDENTCDLNVGRREQGGTRHLKKYNMEFCRLPRMSMTTRNARACRGSAQANHTCVNLYHLCSS